MRHILGLVVATVLLTGSAQGGIILGPEYAQPGHPRVMEYEVTHGPNAHLSFTFSSYPDDLYVWVGLRQVGSLAVGGTPTDAGVTASRIGAPGTFLSNPVIWIVDWNAPRTPEAWDAVSDLNLGISFPRSVSGTTLRWDLPASVMVSSGQINFSNPFEIDAVYWSDRYDSKYPWYSGVVPLTLSSLDQRAVPEPSTLVMSIIASISLVFYRRRAP